MHTLAEQYMGFALAEREQNLRDDSYFYLTVWNPDEGQPEHFQYAATAYGGIGPMHHETVMQLIAATLPAVREAAKQQEARNIRACAAKLRHWELFERGDFPVVFKGDTVEVYKGRKVPKGTRGKVMLVQEQVDHVSRYGTWETRNTYALVDTGSGFQRVNTDHCRVLERGPVLQELFDLSC